MRHIPDIIFATLIPLMILFVGLLALRSCENSHDIAMARLAYENDRCVCLLDDCTEKLEAPDPPRPKLEEPQ